MFGSCPDCGGECSACDRAKFLRDVAVGLTVAVLVWVAIEVRRSL